MEVGVFKMTLNNKIMQKKGLVTIKFARLILIVGIIGGLITGIAIGMIVQQMMITESIERAGEAWEGVISNMNLEIDINETKLVEATYKIFPEGFENDTT